ncbi:hypothetical protein R4282_13555 [Rhodococcus oxybenzonivorans]|uniref:hypothetical protein n=1 Tax=Rhodococcus TaxID=1827 RepID=UPI00131F634A|nr:MULTISPECIES: hypothetical protein [Rhodococcus]MDV7354032.1 hypothetical protein [Rhodococcus oxybenzonivorans]QHE71189.1 hypothetical protein GFS60_04791 [Rhodococcus sp. WAY2]
MSARLSVVDEMFLRTHRGWGTPIVMQGLWRTDGRIDEEILESLRVLLSRGPLGRRVIRSRVPGARPRFAPSSEAFPVEYATVPAAALLEWADEQAALPVDPERGPGWRLACGRLDGSGTVLSLVCSHVLADARGLTAAIADALQGTPPSAAPRHRGPIDDVWDAALLTRRVTEGTVRAVAGLLIDSDRRTELRDFVRADSTARPEVFHRRAASAVVDVDAGAWDIAAEESGGTANSLFLSVVAEIARRDDESAPLTISVPMDVRGRGDTTEAANSVAMVEVAVAPGDTVADVRASSRAAFTSTPMTSPAGFPEEMLQLIPDRLAHALTGNPGERDVLCSNIGPLPDALGVLGGHRTTGIATRAVHPGIVSSRTRMSAYLSRFDGRYTLALESLDVRSHTALRERAEDVLRRHELRAHGW